MNLERIDEIIAKNITITDQGLYEGVFNAVLEAVSEENEACAKILDANADACNKNSMLRDVLAGSAAAIRARGQE